MIGTPSSFLSDLTLASSSSQCFLALSLSAFFYSLCISKPLLFSSINEISWLIFSYLDPASFSVFLFICISNKFFTYSCCFSFFAKRTVDSPAYDSVVNPVLIGSLEIIFYCSRSSAYIKWIKIGKWFTYIEFHLLLNLLSKLHLLIDLDFFFSI